METKKKSWRKEILKRNIRKKEKKKKRNQETMVRKTKQEKRKRIHSLSKELKTRCYEKLLKKLP